MVNLFPGAWAAVVVMTKDSNAVAAVQSVNANELAVAGPLDRHSALAVREQGERYLGQCSGAVAMDLKEISQVDSVGVSVLLCWTRFAQAHGLQLNLINPPSQLRAVVDVSGVSEVISFSA